MMKNSKYKKTVQIITVTTALSLLFACTPKNAQPYYPAYSMTSSASSSSASACASSSSPSFSSVKITNSFTFSPDCYYLDEDYNTAEYNDFEENIFKDVSVSPLSTFSADVDTASYSNVRRMLRNSFYNENNIPKGSIRAEEMINYFSYDYEGPAEDEPFGVNAEISECPWNKDHKLLRLGLQTEAADYSESPDANIVLLIDVSGSMAPYDRLPLAVQSFELMLDNLSKKDRVSIVTYASGTEVVLKGEKGSNKEKIKEALESLKAGGSTFGEGGIEEAYALAEKYYIRNGNNRVILASDGDFNVGRTSVSEMSEIIEKKREKGIYLSVLGFGGYNYSDAIMETLADKGNGNYAYIDSINEAQKVLVDEFCATMVTVAKDVKFQVEFNPAFVSEYRLIGYENRAMSIEDFENDKKDAGEIGAGHSVTVLYEIVPADDNSKSESGLKYQTSTLTKEALESDEWLTLSVRYKEPEGFISKLLEYNIGSSSYTDNPSDDFLFCASVAEYAMLLRKSEYIGDGSWDHVSKTLSKINLNDEYKEDFYETVKEIAD